MKSKLTMAIDCERNGLRGEFLSIAVVSIDKDEIISESCWAVDPENVENINPWVKDNVLPFHPEVTNPTHTSMLIDFGNWWKRMIEQFDITLVGHMIAPVETDLFSKLYELELIGEFEGPYTFFDLNVLLDIVTGKHDSLDAYMQTKGFNFQSHNPLEDAKSALFGYKYLKEDLI